MTREEKQKAINALKISAPIKAVTQEEFKDYIQTLNKIMDWLEQEPSSFKWCTDCKEYDQKKHCCHRWSKVIRDVVKELEQEPRKGHWINKCHSFESCSAECSACHNRSNGYMHDNGFSLECKYYDFCPNCGADMRESEGKE